MQNFDENIIIGLGVTGFSVARFFQRQAIPFSVCDTRTNPPNLAEFQQQFPDVPVYCGKLEQERLLAAQQLIVSPGLDCRIAALQAAKAAGVQIVGDVELFLRQVSTPVVAITGSNGKTSVTHLVGDMAQAAGMKVAVCGNVGTPVLDLLDTAVDLYVLELSSFQLETITSLQAAAAVCLNVSPDHLDRYDSYQDYVQTKQTIYQQAQVAVLNADDPAAWQGSVQAEQRLSFSVQQTADFYWQDGRLLGPGNEVWCQQNTLQVSARHQIANILAAFALGSALNLPQQAMLTAAQHYKGLPHRCQQVANANEVIWLNDSKATNVGSTVAAINSVAAMIKGNIILLAGGDGKGAEFNGLFLPVQQHCHDVILFGKDASKLAEALHDAAHLHSVKDLTSAVELAAQLAKPGDAVLLSPACASLDMFRHYIERGEQFTEQVLQIIDVKN